MSKLHPTPVDQKARDEALNVHASYIMQAPAGSGKTELLTHRFLKLLACVDEPEEVLAITFTRAATAEMRTRILRKLEEAREHPRRHSDDDAMLLAARAALLHAEARKWNLLEQPQRLNIQTIDSLCMSIAHEQPLLARMGGHLQPQEDARPLYLQAARRTLAHLGGNNRELHASLLHLLQLRDNNLGDAQRLIAGMLATRDQWVHTFPLVGNISEDQWLEIRLLLEAPFRQTINRALKTAYERFPAKDILADELVQLANYASENTTEIDLRAISHLRSFPEPNDKFLDQWQCFCNLLLTAKGDAWRKQVNVGQGFPPTGKRYKDRMMELIRRLSQADGLLAALCDLRHLPPARYDDPQWQMLRGLFTVLRHAVAELRVLFAEQNVVDFVELGLSALTVLEEQQPTEHALAVSERIKHLLVDEFQDTSRRQHKLLERLLFAWGPGEGRTCFLVGDPMQSIYMFRQAEVELFAQVQERGIVSGEQIHSCVPLRLSANFRSHAGLTEPLNQYFETIFESGSTTGAAGVSFTPSVAVEAALPDISVCLHPYIVEGANGKATPDALERARKQETDDALAIIEKHLPNITEAESDPRRSYTVAVLGRAKEHLTAIAAALRKRNIPFRAVELESLSERQEIRDLLSLIRALLHPMDRIAWLSVLRAPWCGLLLEDMHVLTGADDKQFSSTPVRQLIEERLPLLSEDGQQRLRRVFTMLNRAMEIRYNQSQSMSLSLWIERTWHSLGGPYGLDDQQKENARVLFRMLDDIAMDGIDCFSEQFDQRLNGLFAQPDPRASERCGVQLMTIHKAKGLGFDVVLVPGLERSAGQDRQQLICMLERVSMDRPGEDEILVAPIGSRGEDTHPLYQWVRKQRRARESEERKRVFYVACTRARRELHLFGALSRTATGELKPVAPDSLLATAWPAIADDFMAAYQAQQQKEVITFPLPAEPEVVDLAAAASSAHPPLRLRRLKTDMSFKPYLNNVTINDTISPVVKNLVDFERPEGSRLQRFTGSAIHTLLDQVSGYLIQQPDADAADIHKLLQSHAAAILRNAALPSDQAPRVLHEILTGTEAAVEDPTGRWLLSAHPQAQSEASWTGWLNGKLQTMRADRIFRAGSKPIEAGDGYFWIIDYKTSFYTGHDLKGFIAKQKEIYEPQLATYANALRKIYKEATSLRLGLYFPRLKTFEYWEA